jgi:hypothetical protein
MIGLIAHATPWQNNNSLSSCPPIRASPTQVLVAITANSLHQAVVTGSVLKRVHECRGQ